MALKGSSFYVILPSNTAVEGNRTNTFRVRLPRKLEFGSDWMVGLAVLVYPRSWPSLGTSAPQFMRIRWRGGHQELKIEIPAGSFKTPMQLLQTLNGLLSSSGRTDLVERLERYQAIIAKLEVDAQQKVEQEISALTHRSNETKGLADKDAELPKLSEKMRRKMYDDYYLKLFKGAFPDKGDQEFIQNTLLHTNDVNIAFGTWIHAYKQALNCCKFVYNEERQHFSLSLKLC